MANHKRTLICTFVALASGLFGGYVGGQLNMAAHHQQCQAREQGLSIPGFPAICQAWVTPGAIWQGSTSGLWVGTILGAFIAGLATRKLVKDTSPTLSLKDRRALQRLLVLLTVKAMTADPTSEAKHLSLVEATANPDLTPSELHQLLLSLGFSQQEIDRVWQQIETTER
jgi:uncharacterized protein YneF (UPF0154 family)